MVTPQDPVSASKSLLKYWDGGIQLPGLSKGAAKIAERSESVGVVGAQYLLS